MTSLAINVGVSLARMWLCKVALVDLAVSSGHVALMLNLTPQFTLGELSRETAQDISRELLDHYLTLHNSGLSILAAPTSATAAENITPQLVNTFMPPLKGEFEYVLVDTAHYLSETTIAVFEHADLVIVLLAPDLASVKATSDAVTILQSLGYPEEQIITVLNHASSSRGLRGKDIEEALGKRLNVVIPYEGEQFIDAINRGTPLVMGSPNAPAAIVMENLAYQLSKPEMREQAGPITSPVLARAKKRSAP